MNNNQYTYNRPPMEQGMPPQMGVPRPRGWRERWMRRFGMDIATTPLTKGAMTVPNWLVGRSIAFFFVAIFVCWGALGYIPDFSLWIISAISTVLFFFGGMSMSKSWSYTRDKIFLRNIFIAGLVVRLLWVLYMYYIFNPDHYGTTYGEGSDVVWYMPFGKALAQWINNGFNLSLEELREQWVFVNDDLGYPMWLGVIYWIFGTENDVFVPLLFKCVMGAYCSISIYRVAKRHFGEGAARIAAIFVCLNPNMIYWCGTMMKETEMVFLVCLAIDNFDRVLSSGQRYTIKNLLPGILSALALMFFRTALGLVMFLGFFSHIVMASNRVMSMGKKTLAGVLVLSVLAVSMGDRIRTQSQELLDTARSNSQKEIMESHAKIKDASGRQQSFAKYAGAAVFAPLIFTIPFPTFNQANEGQYTQMMLSGGSYIKNILSFFVILVMFMMLISGEWRRHVFILAYTLGYHVVLVMSPFAQSGRFHMPVWPMLMLFAAYGVQIAKSNPKLRRWFPIVLVLEVVVCLAWNWFKLKGRGMI